jgi:uncharacterized protein YecT (DUF1311 family)
MGKELFVLSLLTAIAPSLLAPAMAQDATSAAGFPKEVSCDLPTVREVAACTGDQAKLWDKSLNTEYRGALQRVSEDSRVLLVKAQRLWVQYRDANCAVEFAQGGTVSAYYGEQCILNMTKERTRELNGVGSQ